MRVFILLFFIFFSHLGHSYWGHGVTGDLLPYEQLRVLVGGQAIRSPRATVGAFGSVEKRISDSGQLVGSVSLGGEFRDGRLL